MMKVLLYGATGWIGKQIRMILDNQGHQTIQGKARVDNFDEVYQEIADVSPTHVFSSTGRTHGVDDDGKVWTTIDYLELPGKLAENIRDNLRGPMNLARACEMLGVHLTYMGTGCIFEYDEQKNGGVHGMPRSNTDMVVGFTEEDHPNFFGSGYSTVKGQTDLLMRNYPVLNCRIRMPITDDNSGRNFITKITHYEKICSIPNSMTVLNDILPIISHMMSTNTVGTYNMTNPGFITHNYILDMYKEVVDPGFTYKNFTPEEQRLILLSGRSNNYLDTAKLENYCLQNNLTLNGITTSVFNILLKMRVKQ